MTNDDRDARIAAEVAAVHEEHAEEEAEVAETAGENTGLTIPLMLRIDAALDSELRRRAAEARIATSAVVRRFLREALDTS